MEVEIERCAAAKAAGHVVDGGKERFHSVRNGLEAMAKDDPPDLVLIHDGARPFLTRDMIADSLDAAARYGAVVIGHPMVDTAKEIEGDEDCPLAVRTPDRGRLWQVQTPQAFRFSLVRDAYRAWDESAGIPTDDTAVVEAAGHPVRLVPGPRYNLKITTDADLRVARAMIVGKIWDPNRA